MGGFQIFPPERIGTGATVIIIVVTGVTADSWPDCEAKICQGFWA